MSRGAEDRLRELLSERAGTVAPTTDWENRVLLAGRRRRRNRRIGAAAVAAAFVALAAIGVNAVLAPLAFDNPGPATSPTATTTVAAPERVFEPAPLPEQNQAEPAWRALPRGAQTTLPYWFAKRLSVDNGVLTLPDRIVAATGTTGGVVVVTRQEERGGDTLRYVDNGAFPNVPGKRDFDDDELARGGEIARVAMSTDGRLVAWARQLSDSPARFEIRVADLAARTYLDSVTIDGHATSAVDVLTFLGDDVLYRTGANPFRWHPGDTPEAWVLGGRTVFGFISVSEAAGLVLVSAANGCTTAFSLSDGAQRWQKCGDPIGTSFSPDGKLLAGGTSGDIRSAENGEIVAQFGDVDLAVDGMEWESATSLVLMTEPAEGAGFLPAMVRCPASGGACEAVPSLLVGAWDHPFDLVAPPAT